MIIITLFFVVLLSFSTASQKEVYKQGELFKLNLKEFKEPTIRIQTPLEIYLEKPDDNFFILELKEIGNYYLDIKGINKSQRIEFNVLENSEFEYNLQEEKSSKEVSQENYYNDSEYSNEIQEKIIIDSEYSDLEINELQDLEGKTYNLGERIRIDMSKLGNYELKVISESGEISRVASNDFFTLEIKDIGDYLIEMWRGGAKTEHKFKSVSFNEIQEPKKINPVKLEAGKPVKWKAILKQEIIELPHSQKDIQNINIKDSKTNQELDYEFFRKNGKHYLKINQSNNNFEQELELEYYTQAPEKKEVVISDKKKQVKVSAPDNLNYENVFAFTDISEFTSNPDLIKVYWIEQNKYLDFKTYDLNENGLIDRIEWIVPHLSEQNFEISITLINAKSYPTVGGRWNVEFQTIGKNNLTIRPINGTTWSLNNNSEDLKFLSLSCGENNVDYQWINNEIFVGDYECLETGIESSRVFTTGEHDLEFCFGDECVYAENFASNWYNSSWDYRKQLSIGSSIVGSDLTNFPLKVELYDSDLFDSAQSDGDDIFFTDVNGIKLNHELEIYNSSYNSTHSHLIAWVAVNLSSTSDNYFYIYYNNSNAENQENFAEVWDSNYVNVQHLQEISGTHIDSSNNKNATNQGSAQDSQGWIDGANDFQDTQYVEIPSFSGLGGESAATVSYWAKQDVIGTSDYSLWADSIVLIEHGASYGTPQGPGNLRVRWNLGGDWRTAHIQPGALNASWWNLWTFTFDSGTTTIYRNGTQIYQSSDSQSTISSNSPSYNIGWRSGSDGFDGILDEFRISDTSRSSDWVNASYQNQKKDSSFFTLGEEQIRLEITINSPLDNSVEEDITPLLNVTIQGAVNADMLWYTLDDGTTNSTLCTDCLGDYSEFLYLEENNYTLKVYANNSDGTLFLEEHDFEIFLNKSFYDDYNDNSSIEELNGVSWNLGNITYNGANPGSNIKYVYSGSTSLSGASIDVTLPGGATVNTSAAFVVFSTTLGNTAPDNNLVRGHLSDSSTIHFERGDTGGTVSIKWYVAEFDSGVNVESGTVSHDSVTVTEDLTRIFDLNKTMFFGSFENDGSSAWGTDDEMRIRMLDSDTVEGVTGGDPTSQPFVYQAIEYLGANVQYGTFTLSGTVAEQDLARTVDLNKSFVYATWYTSGGVNADDFSVLVNFTDSDTVHFQRSGSASTLSGAYYAVEFTGDENVSTGTMDFGSSDSSLSAELPFSVNISRAIAFTGGHMREGLTSQTDQNAGAGWFTVNLTNSTHVVLTRATTGSTARAQWFVVEFAEASENPRTQGNFTSKSINISREITEITNITWTESGTSAGNNISAEVSVDGGINWHSIIKNQGLSSFFPNNNLVYRLLFSSNSTVELSVSDINITWAHSEPPPPGITIYNPRQGSFIADHTPLLNVSVNKSVSTLWYSTDGGQTNTTICNSCSGMQSSFIVLEEGANTVFVYASDSANRKGINLTTFTLEFNNTHYDNYTDNFSLMNSNDIEWTNGSINFTGVTPKSSLNLALVCGTSACSDANIDIPVYAFLTSNLGYTVTNHSATSFNTTPYDVVIITETVNSGDTAWLKSEDVGVLTLEGANNDEFDLGAGGSSSAGGDDEIRITNNSHYITEEFELGNLLVSTSTSNAGYMSGQSNDVYGLGDYVANPGQHKMVIVEKGGTLTDSTIAANRRAFFGAQYFNYLNSNGTALFQRMVDWVGYNTQQGYFSGNFTSYALNTTEVITGIENVTWNENGTDDSNNITVEISVDNGNNWYQATKNMGIQGITGSSLMYRVLFDVIQEITLSIFDINITWSNEISPPPSIIINSPINSSTISDITPLLNVTLNSTANTLWYKIDSGNPKIICRTCSGTQTTFIYLDEGEHTIDVYSNNSFGDSISNSTSVTLDLNRNFYDDYQDNSSILELNSVNYSQGNVSFTGSGSSSLNIALVCGTSACSNANTDVPLYVHLTSVLGHTVTNQSASVFGTSSYDVIVISESVSSSSTAWLKSEDVGIFTLEGANNDEFDLGTGGSSDGGGDDEINITNNTHYITEVFSIGTLQVSTSTSNAGYMSGQSNDVYGLGDYIANSGQHKIVVVEDGGTLTDSTTAANRRVFFGAQYFNNLNSNGLTIFQRALDWAAYNTDSAGSTGNFSSYYINTTQNVKRLTNITWEESGTSLGNNISVQVSADAGSNWHDATKNQNLDLTEGNNLIYRVLFNSNTTSTISILNMNITWAEPPYPTIYYPLAIVYNSNITSINYTLSVPPGSVLDDCWYSLDGGLTNTTITCYDNISGITSQEGENIWIVYSNDTEGAVGKDSVNFIVDTSAPEITFINQTNEDDDLVNDTNPLIQGENLTLSVNVSDSNIDKVFVTVWNSVKNGAEKVKVFFTYVAGLLWVATVQTDSTWGELNYNYTIYANDTAGFQSEYDGNFSVLGLDSSLYLQPNPSPGTGEVNAFGHINFTNSTYLVNQSVNLWLDGNLLLSDNLTNGNSSWWDVSWGKRKGILINGSTSGAQTDYVMHFIVNYGSGTDSGKNVYCDSNCKTNFGDIRFVNSNGDSLDYFLEEKIDSDKASFWVEVDSIPSYPGNTTIYMYYDNSIQETTSNPENTFLLFEGFEGTHEFTSDSGTTITQEAGGISGSYQADVDGDSNYAVAYNASSNFTREDYFFEGYFKYLTSTTIPVGLHFMGQNSGDNGYQMIIDDRNSGDTPSLRINTGTSGAQTGSYFVGSDNWVFFRAYADSTAFYGDVYESAFDSSTVQSSSNSNTAYSFGSVGVFAYQNGGGKADNIRVRKRASPQPNLLTWTNQETPGDLSDSTAMEKVNSTDTTDNDFRKGTHVQTTYSGGNLTLYGTNSSGNFTKIIDAGARVEWERAYWIEYSDSCSGTITYQQGDVNSFSGTYDTYLDGGNQNTNYGSEEELMIDSDPLRTLIKFNSIGYGKNKIPFNSTILDANITVSVFDAGDPVTVYEVLENWDEDFATDNNRLFSTLWSSDGCGNYPSRSLASETTFNPSSVSNYTFNISNAFKSWTSQSTNNYGVVLDYGGSGGVGIRSSEYTIQSHRPKLQASFTSQDCSPSRVFVRTSNDKSSWTGWQEVTNGGVINNPNIASRYLEYRVELYSFNETYKPYLDEIDVSYKTLRTNSSGMFSAFFASPITFGNYIVCVNSSYKTADTGTCSILEVFSSVAPNVFLIDTEEDEWFSYGNLTFVYNLTDNNDDVVNASLYINSLYNQSNSTNIENNKYNNFTYINFTQGQYNWTVNVTDSSGNSNIGNTRIFYVDLENPSLELIWPYNESQHTTNVLNLSFNASDSLDTTLSCDVVLDGSTIYSGLNVNSHEITNVSSGTVSGGIHYWNVTCSDSSGRQNVSQTFNFNISDSPPEVTLYSPENNYLNGDGEISFVFTPEDDAGFLNCSLILNESYRVANQTQVVKDVNNTINVTGLGEGDYNWTVECFDFSLSYDKPSTRDFKVDLYYPQVVLNLPDESSTIPQSIVSFNFTATDSVDDIMICNLSINGQVENENFNANNASLTNTIANELTDGNKNWNIACADDLGRINTSSSRTFTVAEPPIVYLNTSNETAETENSITLYYTGFDNTNFSSCSLYLNDELNKSNSTNVDNGQQESFVADNLADGTYWWYVNCTDTFGLSSSSVKNIFYIDANPPSIELYEPNGKDIYSSNISFNFSVTDLVDSNLICNLSVDSTVEGLNLNVENNTVYNYTASGITDGFHTWYVNCTDDAGNTGNSLIYNFTRYTTPGISLIYPDDGYWFNSSSFNLTYFPEDDEGFSLAELIINGQVNRSNTTNINNGNNNDFSITGFYDGFYNWSINVTDLGGLVGVSETRTFYVDTKIPELTLFYPNESELFETNNVTFNFSVLDNLDNNMNCDIFIDDEKEFSKSAQNNTFQIEYKPLVDGNHSWYAICNDSAGNSNQSTTINFQVIAPPIVTLQSPADGNLTKDSAITFFYLPEDAIGINECSIYLNGVINDTENNPLVNQQNNFTIQGIIEGNYNWTVNCTDPDTNYHMPNNWSFSRDLTGPNVDLSSPENDSGIDRNQASINFFWTPTDELDNILQCDVTIDGVVRINDKYTSSGALTSDSVSTAIIGQGDHSWNVTCWDQLGNSNTSATWYFNLTYPDFSINTSEIYFNNTSPKENDSVLITATIRNIADANTTNVLVRFYDGNPSDSGIQIGTDTYLNLQEFEIENTSIVWTADMGASEIFVIIDEINSFNELNESNNNASRNISVGGWHYVYGNMTSSSRLELADEASQKVLTWSAEDFQSGNIYAVDYGSTISWSSLQALGRTISGGASSSDFTEIDSVLEMTTFSDSVYNTFTNSGTPKETDTFTCFKQSITEVPVANSTNNTNFKTGILWDTSDDGGSNNEYDSTDKEDIIFVSKLNQDTLGTFGTYDYEMRIPARLRYYDLTDSKTAALYVEIL